MTLSPDNMRFAFGRDKRLCSADEYKQVFEKKDVKVSSSELLILAKINKLASTRLGLVISKKNIRHAVSRNRAKRHIRESFRRSQLVLKGLDVVVLARKGFDKLDDKNMNELLVKQWQKLSNKLEAREKLST